MAPTYTQPSKIEARTRSLAHAVEVLTTRRPAAAVIPRDYARRIRDFKTTQTETYDAVAADRLDDETLALWESFWDAHNQPRDAGSLKVAYLAGPEPLNDFRALVELGVHPFNIWAFESDNAVYNAALETVLRSEFPLLKLQRGALDLFLRTSPTVFDIIYLDACGPLPSLSQNTLRTLADIFRHQRLASPGVLVTNFAAPDESDSALAAAYADLVSNYLYPKAFLEPKLEAPADPEAWNLTEGAVADSFVPKDYTAPEESFFHRVLADLPFHYGQYITRQIFDLGSFVSPWTAFANSEAWKLYFTSSPKEIAAASSNFGPPDDDDDVSVLVTDPDQFAIGWSIAAALNGRNWSDENFPVPEPGSAKLLQTWRQQLAGQPTPGVTAETAMIAYHMIREAPGAYARPTFDTAIGQFDFMRRMHFFCDVPNPEIALLPVIAPYSRPMHYNVEETRRFSYLAKQTRMFLDVIPFDACRYLYDWLPPIDLVPNALELERFQLAFRFALDSIAKHTIRYNSDYFYGVNAIGWDNDGFGEKILRPRLPLE
ncbi:hypothetical protein [Brevundimonas naejangsanensis]|uniref:hypothetical protein n=1 Tax=Brevundimonas naejangsanensis TaxID=588932 RepID=UPI00320808C1